MPTKKTKTTKAKKLTVKKPKIVATKAPKAEKVVGKVVEVVAEPKAEKKTKVKVVEEKKAIITPGGKYYHAVGKRKSAIAKVRIYKGAGVITVNNKPISEYFFVKTWVGTAKSPLKLTSTMQKYDIVILVQGGGLNAQAEAVRHGITRALIQADPLNKPTLKKAGLLTRDPRVKERKKFGLKRARRAPQFSKR